MKFEIGLSWVPQFYVFFVLFSFFILYFLGCIPLSPAHGLIFEVELFMFIDQCLPLSSSSGFISFLFYLFSIPLPVRYLNLFEVLTVV